MLWEMNIIFKNNEQKETLITIFMEHEKFEDFSLPPAQFWAMLETRMLS